MNWMKSFVERILKNKVFWCCVLCVTALSFTAVCYANESGKEYSFWDLFFEGQMRQIFLENDITFAENVKMMPSFLWRCLCQFLLSFHS